LDKVYQGNESLEKYIERFTTLVAEIESEGEVSMSAKMHTFRDFGTTYRQLPCWILPPGSLSRS
jgi:hypothetical protein